MVIDCNIVDFVICEFYVSDLLWSMWIDGFIFLYFVDVDVDREVKEVNIMCLKILLN